MASGTVFRANASPLKRSFDHITISAEPTTYCESFRERRQYAERRSLSLSSTLANHQIHHYNKRRNLSIPSVNSMLAQSTTIMSGSFPSFMSVYGSEDTNLYDHALPEQDTKPEQLGFSQFTTTSNQSIIDSQPRFIERRGSLTSTTSNSTGSSPTTTSSTFDSPLMAEQSPDSSPESASSAAPPKSFQQPRMQSIAAQIVEFPEGRRSTLPTFPSIPPSSPDQIAEEPKKNLKGLTLDMKLPSLLRPSTSSDVSQPFSAPTSPLREPLRTGRRKPTNLSIRTPGFNQLSFGATALAIPPTPGQKSILYQAQSSPSLPTLSSPTTGPIGGMRLALPNIAQIVKRDSYSNGNGPVPASNLPSLREEPYQPPKSQEAPERGYTEGPCLIYDAGVYLYLEPTAEEAANFDTVINVAKEIKTPFEVSPGASKTVVSVWRNAGNGQGVIEPQTATSEISFKSTFEWPPNSGPATPTTPRPSSSQNKKPEYLHVKWDHNSEILEDLFPLCRLIDDRVQDGKKVLIHCQLGVSRSASLIIAYGLYKGYEPDFHSMYMVVKKRSQWVGPNMSLIYQLTDFKSKCDKGAYAKSFQQPKPEWFLHNTESACTPSAGPISARDIDEVPQTTKPVESRPALRLNKDLPPVPPFAGTNETPIISAPIPPSNHSRTARRAPDSNSQEKPAKRAVPRGLPFREMGYNSQQMAIPPHRPRIVPGLTFAQPSMDLALQDVPAAPSLFSPRATEFMAVPFGITTAGDLATSTPKAVKPPPGAYPGGTEWRHSLFLSQDTQTAPNVVPPSKAPTCDPRSPAQHVETKEILRSIDSVL